MALGTGLKSKSGKLAKSTGRLKGTSSRSSASPSKALINSGSASNDSNRIFIIGAVIIFCAAAGALVFVLTGSGDTRTKCEIIKEALAKGSSNSKRFGMVEMSECQNKADCIFDSSTCAVPCPLGYETDENRCQISCSCTLDSHGTFQGDIQFDEKETVGLLKRYGYLEKETGFGAYASSVKESILLWPRNGDRVIIPYVLTEDLKTPELKNIFTEAFDYFTVNTCVDFVPYINQPTTYLNFSSADRCASWSYVGMTEKVPQSVVISPKCINRGIIMHLMMHVLGFEHEHVRPDRDAYVTVNLDVVAEGNRLHFEKIREPVKKLGRPYDMQSLTHISSFSWSTGADVMSITKKNGAVVQLRQSQWMSLEDAEEINILYGCKNYEGNVITGVAVLDPLGEVAALSGPVGTGNPSGGEGDSSGGAGDQSGGGGDPSGGSTNGTSVFGGGDPPAGGGSVVGPSGNGSSFGTDDGAGSGNAGDGNGTSLTTGGNVNGSSPADAGPDSGPGGGGGEDGTSGDGGGSAPAGDQDAEWAEWQKWSDCTETCGVSQAIRFRQCKSVTAKCPGSWQEAKTCEKPDCPQRTTEWDEWSSWQHCIGICNYGFQFRFRRCPSLYYPCLGKCTDVKMCRSTTTTTTKLCIGPRKLP